MSNRLARNFRFMSAGVAGVALVQFALYFLVARYLGTDNYGSFAVALTMALLAAPVCDLGMNISVVWSHARAPEQLPEVLGTSLVVRFALAIPVGALALTLGHALGFEASVLWLFLPLFAAAILDGASGLFSAVFQAKESMGWSSTILLARNIARAAGLGFTLFVGGDLWTLALSWVVASATSAAFSGALVLRHEMIRFRAGAILPLLRTAWPFGSAIIANLLLLQSDILMLGHFGGESEVGIYHAAFRFIVLAELLPHVVSMVVIPRSYRIGHLEGAPNLSRLYRVQTLVLGTVGVVGSLVVALHGDVLTSLALGSGYDSSGPVLIALAPLIFLRFLCVPLGDALSSLGHQRRLCRAAWLAFVTNFILNLWLIPTHGALGAAAATCGSQVCMLGALVWFAHGTGLESHWTRLFWHPLCAVGGVAILFGLAPATAPALLGIAVLALLGLWRFAPVHEHRSARRAAGL